MLLQLTASLALVGTPVVCALHLSASGLPPELPWAPPPLDSPRLLASLRDTSRPRLAYSTYIGWYEDGGLNESTLDLQISVMADRLRPFGWNTVLHDYGWQVCGSTYHVHDLPNGTLGSGCIHVDGYGRLFPSPLRYPSTRVNDSFGSWKPVIDKAHKQGIAFGVHLMQGIPKVAVEKKLPIFGTNFTADEIVAQPRCASFVPDHWAIDATHPGAIKFYDSLVSMWAEQGLDFVYFDGILDCARCHIGVVSLLADSMRRLGKGMFMFTSWGPPSAEEGCSFDALSALAPYVRVGSDTVDEWAGSIYNGFSEFTQDVASSVRPHHFGDLASLMVGKVHCVIVNGGHTHSKCPPGPDYYIPSNQSHLSEDEVLSYAAMVAIFRSPWWPSGVLSEMDDFEYALVTNTNVLRVAMMGENPRQVVAAGTTGIVWTSEDSVMEGWKYVLMVNRGAAEIAVGVDLVQLGLIPQTSCNVTSLWTGKVLHSVHGRLEEMLRPHASLFVRLSDCFDDPNHPLPPPPPPPPTAFCNEGNLSGCENALRKSGSTASTCSCDFEHLERVVLPRHETSSYQTSVATSIDAIYVDAQGNQRTDLHVVGIIYTEGSNGLPDRLLATSAPALVRANDTRSFVRLPFDSAVHLNETVLWIGEQAGAGPGVKTVPGGPNSLQCFGYPSSAEHEACRYLPWPFAAGPKPEFGPQENVTACSNSLSVFAATSRMTSMAKTDDDEPPPMVTLSVADAIVSISHMSEGGQDPSSTLQENVFGVTAYEGGDLFETDNGTEWLTEWGVNMVGFPLSLSNYNLPQPPLPNGSAAACPGPRNITEEELRKWWDPVSGQARTKFVDGPWPSSVYPWGRWIPKIARSADLFVYLLSNSWGNGECDTCLGGPPRNATLWGVANGLAMQLAMGAASSIRYAHIGNEPNAGWFRKVPHNTGDTFAAFFADASLGIKSVVGANVQIGGPVLCWGPLDGYNGLSQWGWFSALMDQTLHIHRSPARPGGVNALDFVDFHAYSNGEENANRVVSEIHMVAAYAATKFGVHMPCAITETSVALGSAANWSNRSYHFTHRTLPRLRQLMALLAHPDKMLTVQEHDLQALAGGYYTFNGCSNLSISCATPEMQMYRAFRPLRGHRLDRIVSGIDDTSMDLRFETSLNTEYGTFGAIVIAAANFGDKLLALILKLEQWREFLDDEIAPWSAVIVDALSLRPWPRPQKSMPSNGSVLAEVQLPAESLVVLTLPLIARHVDKQTCINASQQVPTEEHAFVELFAPAVGVPIDNTSSRHGRRAVINTTVILPDDLAGVSPKLRFGVKGAAVACDLWRVRIDDTYELQWSPGMEFKGGGCRANPSNAQDFNCSQNVAQGLGIGFAEIELHNWIPPTPPPPDACYTTQAGRMWGGEPISIDPWEMAQYTGINASQCCELCRSAVAPACVAFANRQGPAPKEPPSDPRLRTDVCRLLSARDQTADQTIDGPDGALVHSGHPIRREVAVSIESTCDTDAFLAAAKRGDISFLTFLSLVMS